MIWADRVAIAVAALVAIGFGIAFVSNDAPLREAAFRAKAAKLAAACAPGPAVPERPAEAPPAASDSTVPGSAAPGSDATDIQPLPDRVCVDAEKADQEADAEAAKVPTVPGLLTDIGETELFLVAPLWIGLRILDVRTGGPGRRLARSPYWKATEGVRAARRRKRRERTESGP
jgi:hypothetical protein